VVAEHRKRGWKAPGRVDLDLDAPGPSTNDV